MSEKEMHPVEYAIDRIWGDPCDTYDAECPTCQAWDTWRNTRDKAGFYDKATAYVEVLHEEISKLQDTLTETRRTVNRLAATLVRHNIPFDTENPTPTDIIK